MNAPAGLPDSVGIAIIGTGFAGLGMAIRLLQSGNEDFAVFEKADSPGGTWRDNHYPGCACDVQSHVYSFSFAPNARWTRMFAPQPEIRAYLDRCVGTYRLSPRLNFGHELTNSTWDERAHCWRLRFANGKRLSARVLISAMGGLSRPALPNIAGLGTFEGKAFHSQHWDHAYALEGKRVAVIGTGASAIQFVPQIAPRATKLTLFQRTPPWIMPKPDRALTPFEQWMFRTLPFTQKLARTGLYWMLESRVLGFAVHPALMKHVQKLALRHIRRQIADPALRKTVTPDYTIGCKRVLISNDYYPALSRGNVRVETNAIERVDRTGVITADGTHHEVDCLIYGTGFQVADPFAPGTIVGRGGMDIVDTWRNGAHAYLGTSLPGYPNFFMLVGPNTGLGHNSMVFMIESQIEYVLGALAAMKADKADSIEVRPQVEARYNERIQQKLGRAVWSVGGCKSWYIDPRNGKNTTLWPGFTWRFRRATARFSIADYQVFRAPHAGETEPAFAVAAQSTEAA